MSLRLFRFFLPAVAFLFAACLEGGKDPVGLQSGGTPVSLDISGATQGPAGVEVTLYAIVRDSAGGSLTSVPVSWRADPPDLLTVEPTGLNGLAARVNPRRIATSRVIASAGSLEDTLTFTSYLPRFRFVFDDTVPAAERRLILDGIVDANAFHKEALGRSVAESTTVSGVYAASGCGSGGAAAYTGRGTVVFCLGNPGWKNNGPVRKQKIVQHELFHVWQFETGWISNPATAGAAWLIEGAAEWMGYQGLGGGFSFAAALGCQVKEAADFAQRTPPGLPALSTVESRAAFQGTQGPLYTHSMLATEYLLGATASGVLALRAYADSIKAGVAWQASFQSAFGMSTAAFYSRFPGYVAGLWVPPDYRCGI